MKKFNNQVLELIREAIRLEIQGREFFIQAAEMTHNSLGKNMFKRLADLKSRVSA